MMKPRYDNQPRRSWIDSLVAAATGRRMVPIWLIIILVVGGLFRFMNVDWDDQQHLHPDERFITIVTSDIQWPETFEDYFDPVNSPLSPYQKENVNYVYGTFPIFLTKWVGVQLDQDGYNNIYLVGRVLSGLFDLASILFLFLIGRRLYDDNVALIGSALYSVTVLPIQLSHFYATDTFANFFVVGVMYFAVRISQKSRWWDYMLLGVLLGIGMASKLSIVTIGIAVLLAVLVDFSRIYHDEDVSIDHALGYLITRSALIGGLALLIFRILQPIAFEGPDFLNFSLFEKWVSQMREMQELVNGERDIPPFIQWTGRPIFWFGWKNMVVWGMGIPLGLAAWAGWGLGVYELIRRQNPNHLLLVAYIGAGFIYHATRWVQYMRYFIHLYPFLVLLAAYLLVWVLRQAATRTLLVRSLAVLLVLTVTVGTLLYALAFTAIYRQPHSRIAASRWIYANVPQGSALANEHWDDHLPLRIDGKDGFATWYTDISMPNYELDTPQKLDIMVENLTQADYIVLSSNRLYDSIPRLPSRYPMTIRYYDLLFAQELGFEKVAVFTSYPQLFGIEFPDQSADESFSVYDHPKVTIFKKTDDFDPERVRQMLSRGIDWDSVVYMPPKQAEKAINRLMLTEQQQDRYQSAGTWSRLFDRASLVNQLPILTWFAAVEIIGLLAFPVCFLVFGNMSDRGYILSKVLGLLLVSWLVWLIVSMGIVTFSLSTILMVMIALALLSIYILYVREKEIVAFWKERWSLVLIAEVLFWGLFLLFVLVRLYNPDLWHLARGGEKPMDFAYLNAVTKSLSFPPYDPWFAGGYINYYYFGFVLVATLIRLTGIVPEVAYNLAVPTFFAMTALGAFAVVLNLVEGWRFSRAASAGRKSPPPVSKGHALIVAILAILFVTVIGNLGEARLIFEGLQELSVLDDAPDIPVVREVAHAANGLNELITHDRPLHFRDEWWYWNATRVIPHPPEEAGPINEFPMFTFLYADLHAHMMALPYTLLVLALLVNLLREQRNETSLHPSGARHRADTRPYHTALGWRRDEPEQTPAPGLWQQALAFVRQEGAGLFALALTIGALWPMNTWDLPTYAVLSGAALACREYMRRQQVDTLAVWHTTWRWLLVIVAGYLLFLPFHHHYANAYGGAELWDGSRTPLSAYLTMHGFFLFIIISYLLSEVRHGRGHNAIVRLLRVLMRRWRRFPRLSNLHGRIIQAPSLWYVIGLYLVFGILFFSLALALFGQGVFALTLLLMVVTGLLLLSPQPEPRRQFVLCLIGMGLALTFVVEFVVLKGDIGRMNTVFKFYLQVWVLWGVATAAILATIAARLWSRARSILGAITSMAWWGGFVLLFLACLLYPIFAIPYRIDDRMDPEVEPTLDGMAYMHYASYTDQGIPFSLDWDLQAIRWMRHNVAGSPVIVEANTPLYRWGARVSIYTGLPVVIGWDWHQKQQRAVLPGEMIDRRIQDVIQIYTSSDPQHVADLLETYEVRYIYIGALEKIYYGADVLERFEQHEGRYWERVYENAEVRIYRVIPTPPTSPTPPPS